MVKLRRCFMEKRLAADKVAALKAVGVEFDDLKAQAIREQHEGVSSGKGKEAEDGMSWRGGVERWASEDAKNELDGRKDCFEKKLEELTEYKRRHGAILRRVLAGIPVAVVGPYAALSDSLPRVALCMLCFLLLICHCMNA